MNPEKPLPKSPTGIQGLDEITGGGLPTGRPTLVCGDAGCGKTLLAMEFLVRGATRFDEPGVFMAFEETGAELAQNVASLGFDLDALIAAGRLVVDYVYIERSEIEETGEFDLEGLFVRLGYAIDSIGARRVVLDTVETLFAGLPNPLILRAELRRLFRWLKERGVTAIITGERGAGSLTRQGLEEYVSDCVIMLDHRVKDLISTRRLRVVKYRGSTHGTNEYPFVIDSDGIAVLPITSLGLGHSASTERVSSGIPRLDAMLAGAGFYRGSSILVSGTAGTGKTSLAGHFAAAACGRGERVLFFAFEESPSQIMRNLGSVGIDLAPWVDEGLLQFQAARPTVAGLEIHLTTMHKAILEFRPRIVIIDPLNSFISGGNEIEVKAMLLRLLDFLKMSQITGFFTNLTAGGSALDHTDAAISSLIDSWLVLLAIESGGERNRAFSILKSRGMAHSNQTREFLLTAQGVELRDVYVGPGGVLTGSARLTQEAQDTAAQLARRHEIERGQRELEQRRATLEAQIAALRTEFAIQEADTLALIERHRAQEAQLERERADMAASRKADAPGTDGGQP
ncbi:circadian clock protein KaiC [Candidatus Thiodictyon syntrophicum]|jgi:circadian clock protein KaiC|uniref:non-specific serine/threonine protein kinase n=1 Tax=Candidatus Thiodictyon syntrophicum TaxID=1166950 RepID=A0A2K8UBK0_9GAMM|nr:circadian clock protein KaiC [Candidatus Thiodictyon syntrophicum]AUB82970.1 KaiC 1 [Candidatus Thiodictyon syntrophicum]